MQADKTNQNEWRERKESLAKDSSDSEEDEINRKLNSIKDFEHDSDSNSDSM